MLKVCLFVNLESSDCRIYWTKSTRLDRSNLMQIIFSTEFPTQPKPSLMCRVLYFTPSIKEKNSSYVLEVFDMLCVESLVRSRGVYLYTHLGLSRFMLRTWWLLQLLHKEFKEDLKPLSGVSKSQVGILVIVVDQGKKQFVDLELSRGRGSKFSTRGNNRMLEI